MMLFRAVVAVVSAVVVVALGFGLVASGRDDERADLLAALESRPAGEPVETWSYGRVAGYDDDPEVFAALASHVAACGADCGPESVDALYYLSLDEPSEQDRFLAVVAPLGADRNLDPATSMAVMLRAADLWPRSEPVFLAMLADDDPVVRQRALVHLPDTAELDPEEPVGEALAAMAADPGESQALRSGAGRRLAAG
ncbi:MAG: hypothetical protein ACK5PP_13330 [Acidimicrobiales bacterium]